MATFNLLRATYSGSLGNTTGQVLRGTPILKAKIEYNRSKTDLQTAQRSAYYLAKEQWLKIAKPFYAYFRNPNYKKLTPFNDFMHSATSYMRDPQHSLSHLRLQVYGAPLFEGLYVNFAGGTIPSGYRLHLTPVKNWGMVDNLTIFFLQFRPSDSFHFVTLVTPTETVPYVTLHGSLLAGDGIFLSVIGVNSKRDCTQSADIAVTLPTA